LKIGFSTYGACIFQLRIEHHLLVIFYLILSLVSSFYVINSKYNYTLAFVFFFFNLIGSDLVKLVEQTVRSENCHSPNRPIYLVGESLGACLALAVAVRNPDIDLSLILANPGTLRIEN
jgi:pimeloyl-ACP methyl ester carboxylesterase